jgi:hypothetical protein
MKVTVWMALSVVCMLSTRALADVTPEPPGDVEPCSLERTCPAGKACVVCPADYRDFSTSTSVCSASLSPLGFHKQCQSRGASAWDEIWCRPAAGSLEASVTLEPRDASVGAELAVMRCADASTGSGCASCGITSSSSAGPPYQALALALLLWLLLRRSGHRTQL